MADASGGVSPQGRRRVLLHLTGFGKFNGVPENPTTKLMDHITGVSAKGGDFFGLTEGCQLASVDIVDTSADGVGVYLATKQTGALAEEADAATVHILVHCGVNAGASGFALERTAANEATFRCPDEDGWQPTQEAIRPDVGDYRCSLKTRWDTPRLVSDLQAQCHAVEVSDDAGRFVCNYLLFSSLQTAREIDSEAAILPIFLHVPAFSTVDMETQLGFLKQLVLTLCQDAQAGRYSAESEFVIGDAPDGARVAGGEAGSQSAAPGGAAAAPGSISPDMLASAIQAAGGIGALAGTGDQGCKMVVVVRRDLGMSPGKVAAQCCHAALYASQAATETNPALVATWNGASQKIVVLGVSDAGDLGARVQAARAAGLPCAPIRDAGRTEVSPGTTTCAAIGPALSSVVDLITGDLRPL